MHVEEPLPEHSENFIHVHRQLAGMEKVYMLFAGLAYLVLFLVAWFESSKGAPPWGLALVLAIFYSVAVARIYKSPRLWTLLPAIVTSTLVVTGLTDAVLDAWLDQSLLRVAYTAVFSYLILRGVWRAIPSRDASNFLDAHREEWEAFLKVYKPKRRRQTQPS